MLGKRGLSLMAILAGLAIVAGSLSLFRTESTASAEGPGAAEGVTATAEAVVAAFNRGDFGALLPLFSDQGFEDLFDQSKIEAASDDEFFGDQVTLHAVRSITGTDTDAKAIVEIGIGLGIEANEFTLAVVDGRWRIEASKAVSAAVAAGAKVIDLKLQEYAFLYDKSAVAAGNVAFNVMNTGKEQHEIIVFKVEESTSVTGLMTALLSEDESSGPPPIEDFGFLGLYDPAEGRTAAFSHPLEAGKYMFVCFVSAPDGAPHVAKGMISEFTVGTGASSGGAITPPNTGDAGLLDGGGSIPWVGLLVLGVVMSGAGALGVARAKRA
jgi:hypothetical protein